ncbi:MAG: alanine--tRNA ligase [Chloroflexota bacterium]|nr:alanine--tRNA ligase [Chloroflexota bacterium]
MKEMSSAEVRQAFLDFFEEMGHRALASSSLVPADDPTLLFANSGMVQFKDVFLGLDRRDYSRATTSQKCMRVSGKHNDLENVGPSPRHHTFFEMLGNFSFGDYFKRDAIRFAFDLLTEVYGLPAERLAVTVYENDDESYDCWVKEIGINPRRVARMGPSTNFWQMADTGPCGPNSEIHWDKFPEQGDEDVIALLQAEDDRFLEIWNLVFMQFNRQQADPEHTGKWDAPLPAPGVDTGMGFERILTILQGVEANYETDLFTPIIRRTQALTGHSDEQRDADIVPYRVIADHIRAAVFLISDGVMPGAKGRAAIPRIVIRRAARFGREIGFERPFLADIADTVIDIMGGHYSELVAGAETIKRVITLEEERFLRTMDRGLNELDEMLAQLDDSMELSGQQAFYLKATLGLPYQVTKDVAEERGFSVDEAGFAEAEAEHALISGGGTAMGEIASAEAYRQLLTDLQAAGALPADGVRYDPYKESPADTEILALMREGRPVDSALVGEAIEFVLGETRFYVEAGGQVSDTGTVSGAGWVIEVEAMKQPVSGLIVHVGQVVEGGPARGDSASAQVDRSRRMDITRNHTATHLLHAALRNKLGRHVQQRGSLVAPDRLRFDFSHPEKVTERELSAVAAEISGAILNNYPVCAAQKSLEQARREGAMALFGEKYGDTVRTVAIEDGGQRYSYELCGGAHVGRTSEIGSFVFTSEGSVSAGIRRVEALTGRAANDYLRGQLDALAAITRQLGAAPELAAGRIGGLKSDLDAARREIKDLQRKLARDSFHRMIDGQLESLNGLQALVAELEDTPVETLREMTDWFRNRVDRGVMVLASAVNGRPQIVVAVSDSLIKDGLRAGDLIKPIARIVGGGGGGRPQMAQAGGKDTSKISDALEVARDVIAAVTEDID